MRIPDIHRIEGLRTEFPGNLFCKTHFVFSGEHPYINNTLAFIYVMRHPRDILLSSMNFIKMEEDIIRSDTDFAVEFIEHMGVPKWRDVGMGNWVEHVNSWLARPLYPHLVLRYEDMLKSPEESFRKVIQFINVPLDEQKLQRAIRNSSFKSLKKIEETEKSKEIHSPVFSGIKAVKGRYKFMNKGRAGQSLGHLGKDVEARFNEKFKDILTHFRYDQN